MSKWLANPLVVLKVKGCMITDNELKRKNHEATLYFSFSKLFKEELVLDTRRGLNDDAR